MKEPEQDTRRVTILEKVNKTKKEKIQVMGFVYVPAIQSHFVTLGDYGLCAGAAQLKKNIIIWHLELYGQEI